MLSYVLCPISRPISPRFCVIRTEMCSTPLGRVGGSGKNFLFSPRSPRPRDPATPRPPDPRARLTSRTRAMLLHVQCTRPDSPTKAGEGSGAPPKIFFFRQGARDPATPRPRDPCDPRSTTTRTRANMLHVQCTGRHFPRQGYQVGSVPSNERVRQRSSQRSVGASRAARS